MNINVTRDNKSELGMNRNDFYEYKKQRAMELAKRGATVGEIGKDLGMSEKEMYAFLSRNFGGIRRMRSNDTATTPQLKMASMNTAKDMPNIAEMGKSNKSSKAKEVDKPVSILSAFSSALSMEKEKLLNQFKSDLETESKAIVGEVEIGLTQLKIEMLTNFKNDIMKDLSELAKSL